MDDADRDLHERLLAEDPLAPTDLAIAYYQRLERWLTRTNRHVDPHLCATAAGDAIISLSKNPSAYRPDRGSLERYLRMAAQGDLKNLLRAERRHAERRVSLEAVELSPLAGNALRDPEADPALIVERRERLAERTASRSSAIWGRLTAVEVAVLSLMQEGERKTIRYAEALGIADLPEPEQRRVVKRAKDRLKKRLARSRAAPGRSSPGADVARAAEGGAT
jgi:hypothetical protein